MKKRNILLLEPNYSNKYPPLGLMKLASYHRMLGDNVVFYKGNLNTFLLNFLYEELLVKLQSIEPFPWSDHKKKIIEYIKTGKNLILTQLTYNHVLKNLISSWLKYYKDYYKKKEYIKNPYWDRICITTLFTFNWNITIETINFAKLLVKDINELWVGGVMASVIPDKIEKATGIKPYQGLLNRKGILDKGNKLIIDELPLDYSILDEIDYKYPMSDGYYSYMTRGCIRKCKFCAVPTIEPKFIKYIPLSKKIFETAEKYGEKQNLLLLDNNVLASSSFPRIIKEIKKAGFQKGALFVEPNQLTIAIKNLKKNLNNRAYINKTIYLLANLLNKLRGDEQQRLYNLLEKHKLLNKDTATKKEILKVYPVIADLYDRHRNKRPRKRYVDFNQGLDPRLLKEDKMKLISEISINPLRLSFDKMVYKKQYISAVDLAVKYDINKISNYLLYNEKDEPVELYQRLKINVELCEKYNINIYSFPMKYHPVQDIYYFSNRNYIGKFWNKKFIRAVQAVLNATKGKIGKGMSYFEAAFGADENEFFKILYMPETYIIYRYFFRDAGFTEQWWEELNNLSNSELELAKSIIENNEFGNISVLTNNRNIQKLLKHYSITRGDIKNTNTEIYKLKMRYDESISNLNAS